MAETWNVPSPEMWNLPMAVAVKALDKAIIADEQGAEDAPMLFQYALDLEYRSLQGPAFDPDVDYEYCWCGQSKMVDSRFCGPIHCMDDYYCHCGRNRVDGSRFCGHEDHCEILGY